MTDTLPIDSEAALPPPAPLLDPRPRRQHLQWLTLLVLGGAAAIAAGLLTSFRHHALLVHSGFFFVTYAFVVGASWLPPGVLSRRVDATLDRWVRNSTGGYYGVVALATFVQLEVASTFDTVVGFSLPAGTLSDFAMGWITRFSTESVMNLVWGFSWPGKLLPEFGAPAVGVFVFATWSVFRLGREVLPHAGLQPRPRDKIAAKAAKLEKKAAKRTRKSARRAAR